MTTIQERLQLKRVPLDTWNIREQLCLASAVVRSGDQNWMSVSRALKTVGEANRPPDWYSQKSCAAQYGAMLEHVETPKRKKRNSEGAVETPQESILKRLTQERIVEIQKTIAEMNQQYDVLKNEITEVRNPNTSDDRLKELWAGVEAAKRAKERETARRAAWLKEREERRAKADRTWRPQPTTPTPTPPGTPVPPSSPLLTSLLKSSPVVTTPQHISHPANVVETVSPSATAPTLSMLLEKPTPSSTAQHESKHAAIEHIKNQLVQIEQQLIASTSANVSPVASVSLAPPAPAVDIDDIEIKEEDVYAFRDIDLHIPPVTAMHKTSPRVADGSSKPSKKDDEDSVIVEESPQVQEEIAKEETMTAAEEPAKEIVETQESNMAEELPSVKDEVPQPPPPDPEPEVTVSFPEVKFPTPEIKVIHPDDQKVKEEAKEVEMGTDAAEVPPEPETVEEVPPPPLAQAAEQVIENMAEVTTAEMPQQGPEVDPEPPKETENEDLVAPEDIPLPPDAEDGPEKPNEVETTEPVVEESPEVSESKEDEDTTESKSTSGDSKSEQEDTKEENNQTEQNVEAEQSLENEQNIEKERGEKEQKAEKEHRVEKEPKAEKEHRVEKEQKAEKEHRVEKEQKAEKEHRVEKEQRIDKEQAENEQIVEIEQRSELVEIDPKAVKERKAEKDSKATRDQKLDKEPKTTKDKVENESKVTKEQKVEKDSKAMKSQKVDKEPKSTKDQKVEKETKSVKEQKLDKEQKAEKEHKVDKEREEKKSAKEQKADRESKDELFSPSSKKKKTDDIKKDDDSEDSIPLKEMIKPTKAAVKSAPEPQVDDDDTPMELSREEEKDGRKRRDYSRKKKAEARSSESANEVIAPDSPSASEHEKQHRLWKKSVMLVYSRLCAHKYASLFLRPISDEEAPGYSMAVRRPMDLSTIRKNIDAGSVRTTAEFQRDVLLMLSNALMYNSSEHSVYAMAKEMQEEATCQLGMLLAAQAHAGLQPAPPARRKRKGRADTPPYVPPKRHREKVTP